MDQPANSLFETVVLLCKHHGVDEKITLKRYFAGKTAAIKRAFARKKCVYVMPLLAKELDGLGIGVPAYRLRIEMGNPFLFFIGTYRDGSGQTIKYGSLTTVESLRARTDHGTTYPAALDDAGPKSGSMAELMSAARVSGEEGRQDLRRRS